jgi:hypothetical protein
VRVCVCACVRVCCAALRCAALCCLTLEMSTSHQSRPTQADSLESGLKMECHKTQQSNEPRYCRDAIQDLQRSLSGDTTRWPAQVDSLESDLNQQAFLHNAGLLNNAGLLLLVDSSEETNEPSCEGASNQH